MRRALALIALTAVLGAGGAHAAASAQPQDIQRHLLAQVSVTVRGWVRLEGYRQAGAPMTEARAIALVRQTYPELTDQDARPLAFLLVMSAASEVTEPTRIAEYRQVAGGLLANTSDRAPRALRQLR